MTEKRSSPDDNTEVSESSYSPSKRTKVNNRTVEEKEEVTTVASKNEESLNEENKESNATYELGDEKDEDDTNEEVDEEEDQDQEHQEEDFEEEEEEGEEEEEETEYEDDSSSHVSAEYDNEYGVEKRRLKEYFDGRLPSWKRINKAAIEIILQDQPPDDYLDSYYDEDDYAPGRGSSPIPSPIPRDELKCKCNEDVAIYVTGEGSQFTGEEYAVCGRHPRECDFYALVEFAHFKCHCGDTAKICISKNGAQHNNGRRFAVCNRNSGHDCGYWKWTDGQTGQEAFNEYMDAMHNHD